MRYANHVRLSIRMLNLVTCPIRANVKLWIIACFQKAITHDGERGMRVQKDVGAMWGNMRLLYKCGTKGGGFAAGLKPPRLPCGCLDLTTHRSR